MAIHGGCDDERSCAGEGDGREGVVGEAVGEFGDNVSCGGCDEEEVGLVGELDMARVPGIFFVEDAKCDGVAGEGLECEWGDEFGGGGGHDGVDAVAGFDEEACQLCGFEGGDGASDAKEDGVGRGHRVSSGRVNWESSPGTRRRLR